MQQAKLLATISSQTSLDDLISLFAPNAHFFEKNPKNKNNDIQLITSNINALLQRAYELVPVEQSWEATITRLQKETTIPETYIDAYFENRHLQDAMKKDLASYQKLAQLDPNQGFILLGKTPSGASYLNMFARDAELAKLDYPRKRHNLRILLTLFEKACNRMGSPATMTSSSSASSVDENLADQPLLDMIPAGEIKDDISSALASCLGGHDTFYEIRMPLQEKVRTLLSYEVDDTTPELVVKCRNFIIDFAFESQDFSDILSDIASKDPRWDSLASRVCPSSVVALLRNYHHTLIQENFREYYNEQPKMLSLLRIALPDHYASFLSMCNRNLLLPYIDSTVRLDPDEITPTRSAYRHNLLRTVLLPEQYTMNYIKDVDTLRIRLLKHAKKAPRLEAFLNVVILGPHGKSVDLLQHGLFGKTEAIESKSKRARISKGPQ
ncbi:MAG: hypothetical protein VXZ73_00805 [Pseudomonadota bacterium]|nr:hypothetical protein [Pseudomonadota bacterium]